jgi:hypothetical protein
MYRSFDGLRIMGMKKFVKEEMLGYGEVWVSSVT